MNILDSLTELFYLIRFSHSVYLLKIDNLPDTITGINAVAATATPKYEPERFRSSAEIPESYILLVIFKVCIYLSFSHAMISRIASLFNEYFLSRSTNDPSQVLLFPG